jgi:hypothetical protein
LPYYKVSLSLFHIIWCLFEESYRIFIQTIPMRAYQVGPGSSRSTWKATLDPGKNLPCSNSGGQRAAENDIKSQPGVGTNGPQTVPQSATEQKK